MSDLLFTAIKAAIEAGKNILSIYNDPNADFSIERKKDNSPLTIADRKSHETIEAILQSTELPVLSEEGRDIPYEERKNWELFWMIDPLDGTKEFIKKNGEFTVNIALINRDTPVAGVIYVPVTGELYFASKEAGARKVASIEEFQGDWDTLIKKSYSLPEHSEKNQYTIVASRSHMSPETEAFINQQKEKHQQVEIVSKGSSLKICLVAEGKAEVYPRFAPTMEWDTAAGHAIAKHAGKNIYLTDEITPMKYNKENLLNSWFIVK